MPTSPALSSAQRSAGLVLLPTASSLRDHVAWDGRTLVEKQNNLLLLLFLSPPPRSMCILGWKMSGIALDSHLSADGSEGGNKTLTSL